MSIDKGSLLAIYNLANYYEDQKDYDNMIKYDLMGVDNR